MQSSNFDSQMPITAALNNLAIFQSSSLLWSSLGGVLLPNWKNVSLLLLHSLNFEN